VANNFSTEVHMRDGILATATPWFYFHLTRRRFRAMTGRGRVV